MYIAFGIWAMKYFSRSANLLDAEVEKIKWMKKTIDKVSAMLQVLLLAPIKLPGKVANVLKYIAVGVGLLQRVLEDGKPDAPPAAPKVPENPDDLVTGDRQEEAGQ